MEKANPQVDYCRFPCPIQSAGKTTHYHEFSHTETRKDSPTTDMSPPRHCTCTMRTSTGHLNLVALALAGQQVTSDVHIRRLCPARPHGLLYPELQYLTYEETMCNDCLYLAALSRSFLCTKSRSLFKKDADVINPCRHQGRRN